MVVGACAGDGVGVGDAVEGVGEVVVPAGGVPTGGWCDPGGSPCVPEGGEFFDELAVFVPAGGDLEGEPVAVDEPGDPGVEFGVHLGSLFGVVDEFSPAGDDGFGRVVGVVVEPGELGLSGVLVLEFCLPVGELVDAVDELGEDLVDVHRSYPCPCSCPAW